MESTLGQPGCSTVAVWRDPTAPPHLTFYLQNRDKIESRRADSNRLPLLQLRVCLRTF
jgi:hypothetical protein